MRVMYPRCSGLKASAPSRCSVTINIEAQESVTLSPEQILSFRLFVGVIVSSKEPQELERNVVMVVKKLRSSFYQWHQCHYSPLSLRYNFQDIFRYTLSVRYAEICWSLPCIQYIVYSIYFSQYIFYSIQYIGYSIYYIVYSIQFILYSIQYIVYSI